MSSFLLLCECLSKVLTDPPRAALAEQLAVPETARGLIEAADREMLAPALWLALDKHCLIDCLPAQEAAALRRRYQMNALLNERIRSEADHVAKICASVGVTPVALKGGAFLYEASADELGSRAMRDLDFLVPVDEIETVAEAMFREGYKIKEGESEDWNYTYPGLERPGGLVAVELHQYVGQQRSLLVPDLVWPLVQKFERADCGFRRLSPAHRVWHNVFHSQIQDRGHGFGFVWLRQLADLVDISTRHHHQINWPEVEALFQQQNLLPVLTARLYQAHKLLGLEWPLERAPSRRDRFLLNRSIYQADAAWAQGLARFIAGVTAPLKKYHIDLVYKCGTDSFWRLTYCRAQHATRVARTYQGGILKRAWNHRQYDV